MSADRSEAVHARRTMKRSQKKNPNESGNFDRNQTPVYALEPLLLFIPSSWVIWESACGDSNLVRGLRKLGYRVIATDILYGQNFFTYQPAPYNVQLTNPPFSVKLKWLIHSYSLGKPFALLMPVDFMGGGAAQRLFEQFGIEIILLNKRVDFETCNTSFAKSSAWFSTCWYTWGLNIGQPLSYGKILKRPDSQLPLFPQGDPPHP